jgi:hypothetical protein
MKTDQLPPDRASWQTAGLLVRNGASSPCAANEQGVDAAAAAYRAAWQRAIEKLTEWARNPKELEDDGLAPPSAEIVQRAIAFAQAAQQAGYPPPTSVVPDPNGGIIFERTQDNQTEEYHFWDDGTIDYCRFEGTRLVERRDAQ